MSRNNIVATFARNLNNAANAAKTPITNIASNIASNISSVVAANTNSFNVAASAGSNTFYMWILAIVLVLGVAYLIKKYVVDEYPGMIESWFVMFRKEQQRGAADIPAPPMTPPQPSAPVHPDTESWCFVGEDLTGRYCVKVPSKSSCESSRTFTSRQDCEMVPAQHLPAGVITKQGAGMLPLM